MQTLTDYTEEELLPEGYGYFDCTAYPIGGLFCRSPIGGVLVHDIKRLSKRVAGCDCTATTADNRKIAFQFAHLDGKGAVS